MGAGGQTYERPAEAGGRRPGQAGAFLLAGTRPEHITGTLVDLAIRGHVRIDAASDTDWQLTRLSGRPDRLLRYEKELLRAVLGRAGTARLAELPESGRKAIGRVHTLLTRDALRGGAIRPNYSDSDAGPDLRRLRAFRDQLQQVPPAWRSMPSYLPYAIAFGLGPQWARHVEGVEFGWLVSATGGFNAVPGWMVGSVALSWQALGYHHGGGHHGGGHHGGGHHDGGHHGGGHHDGGHHGW